MKIAVFCVVYWDDEQMFNEFNAALKEWKSRLDRYIDVDYYFSTTGTYSDPTLKLDDLDTIQLGISQQVGVDHINPWKSGIMTGIYHTLMNVNYDLLIYAHWSILLDDNLNDIIMDFYKSDKLLCAPQQMSQIGTVIETGFMVMKPDAVKRFAIHWCGKDIILNKNSLGLCVEHQALLLFYNDWYIMYPHIPTIKKYQPKYLNTELTEFETEFEIDEDDFLNLPMIFGSEKHCGKELLNKWKIKHQI